MRRSNQPGARHDQQRARLLALVDRFTAQRVAVVGDLVADEFIYGQVSRVSREAPVLILNYDSTEIVPGGAGNAANNVATLGGTVEAIGLVGRDESGRRLVSGLHRRVTTSGIVRPRGYRTVTKTRILAGGVHSAKQQVVRIDRETAGSVEAASRQVFERRAETAVGRCDAVLISDYGFGLTTPRLALRLRGLLRGRDRQRRVPILVDSRYGVTRYRGLTGCTPNESEVEQLLGVTIDEDAVVLERAGRTILKRARMQGVLVTRGSRGMALFEPRRPTVHLPIVGSDQVADVTGAGDTVVATVTLALAAGASFLEAAQLANFAGGLVVMKRGTATVAADELRQAILADPVPALVPRSPRRVARNSQP